jgi:hypothetical protein
MVKSYLMSSFVRTHGYLDEEAFRRAEPQPWLVWEAGPWKPGGAKTIVGVSSPTPVPARIPKGAEALAFALTTRQLDPESQVTLGRGETCDIIINDGTVSTLHLVFAKGAQGWTVADAGSRNGSTLQGAPLGAGRPIGLVSGARLTAGSVDFSFYEWKDMLWRLKQYS